MEIKSSKIFQNLKLRRFINYIFENKASRFINYIFVNKAT